MSGLNLSDLPTAYRAQVERQLSAKVPNAGLPAAIPASPEDFVEKGKPKGPNATEEKFRVEMLEGRRAIFEGITFKLAGGSRYTPDWIVPEGRNGLVHCYEIKGAHKFPSENRALVAFRECAALYSRIVFEWWRLDAALIWRREH